MEKMNKLKNKIEEKIEDPRRQYGDIMHKLVDILIIGICTIICGGEDFIDMEEFGKEREEWLRKFLELANGIPDSETFRRVYERIKPEKLSECLYEWLEAAWEERPIIAIDGKTIRGSGNKKHKAYHVVSAFVSENNITFGEITVEEKSNEITAVPELIEMPDVEGAIITADAMSCQKNIVSKIIEGKADYVIALKGNQETMHQKVKEYFENKNIPESQTIITNEKNHGREEKRSYYLETELSWLETDSWLGLKGVGFAKSIITENGETKEYIRYFIASITSNEEFGNAVRNHWSIENQLHWSLDVTFKEDAARARKDNSPLNMNILRKTALPLLKNVKPPRIGLKKLMFKAALSLEWLEKILFTPL